MIEGQQLRIHSNMSLYFIWLFAHHSVMVSWWEFCGRVNVAGQEEKLFNCWKIALSLWVFCYFTFNDKDAFIIKVASPTPSAILRTSLSFYEYTIFFSRVEEIDLLHFHRRTHISIVTTCRTEKANNASTWLSKRFSSQHRYFVLASSSLNGNRRSYSTKKSWIDYCYYYACFFELEISEILEFFLEMCW